MKSIGIQTDSANEVIDTLETVCCSMKHSYSTTNNKINELSQTWCGPISNTMINKFGSYGYFENKIEEIFQGYALYLKKFVREGYIDTEMEVVNISSKLDNAFVR